MTSNQFNTVGELLFGPSWRGVLALAIGVADRTVRRWADGADIPDGVDLDLAELCDAKAAKLTAIAVELRKGTKR